MRWAQPVRPHDRPAAAGAGAVTTDAAWVRELQRNHDSDVALRVIESPSRRRRTKTRPLAERRGSFLFTHFGLSGPVVLDVSRAVSGHPNRSRSCSSAIFCRRSRAGD